MRESVEGWEEFWADYPKKKDKGDAHKAYVQAIKAAGDFNDVLDALVVAKEDDHRFLGDPKWIPHPARWLRAGDWHAPKANGKHPPVMETAHAD